jgi:hypothetical protein
MKQEQLKELYNSLGHRFIEGGDYKGKHTDWESRLITPRGPEVLKKMKKKKFKTSILGGTHVTGTNYQI